MRTNNNINNRIYLDTNTTELKDTPKNRWGITGEQMILIAVTGTQKREPLTVGLKNSRAFECLNRAMNWVEELKAKHNQLNITFTATVIDREEYLSSIL